MASQKVERWIDLIAALLRRPDSVSYEELTGGIIHYFYQIDKAKIRRMFERDLAELRAFGLPIETVTDPGGQVTGYRLNPRHFFPAYLTLRSLVAPIKPKKKDPYGYKAMGDLLAFYPDLLPAVLDAAQRVRQLGDPVLAEHAASALRKLAPPPPPPPPPDAGAANTEVLATLSHALEKHKRVTFSYPGVSESSDGRRTVEPFGLFRINGQWQLAGRAPGEKTVKNFRVSRIAEPVVNQEPQYGSDYAIPEEFNLRAHARSRPALELGGETIQATVQFRTTSGPAGVAYRMGEEVKGHPQNRTFRVRRADAFARWLLSFGGDLVPVSPRSLVDEFRGLVRETIAHHSATPSLRPSGSPPVRP